MSIPATYSKGFQGDPCPTGRHKALLVHIEKFGIEVHETYGPKDNIGLIFQVETLDEKGKRYIIRAKVTNLISSKSKLGGWLEHWRTKKFTKDELQGFDLSVLVDKTCYLDLVVSDDGQWSNIFTISHAAKDETLDYVVDERITDWVKEDMMRRERLEKEEVEKAKSTGDRAKDLDDSDSVKGEEEDDLPF